MCGGAWIGGVSGGGAWGVAGGVVVQVALVEGMGGIGRFVGTLVVPGLRTVYVEGLVVLLVVAVEEDAVRCKKRIKRVSTHYLVLQVNPPTLPFSPSFCTCCAFCCSWFWFICCNCCSCACWSSCCC
jgi:hypothetical protein